MSQHTHAVRAPGGWGAVACEEAGGPTPGRVFTADAGLLPLTHAVRDLCEERLLAGGGPWTAEVWIPGREPEKVTVREA